MILSRRKGKNFRLHNRRACESKGTDSLIRNLGFDGDECSAHPPVALRGRNSRYSLNRRLGVPSSRSGGFEKEKNLCFYQESNPRSSSLYSKLNEDLSSGNRFVPCGWTDRHGEAFYSFPNWPKNGSPNCKIIDLGQQFL